RCGRADSWLAGPFMHAAPPRRLARTLPGIILGLLAGSLALARAEAPAGPKVLALVGGEVLTPTDAGAIEGPCLVRDGKVVAVGPKVEVPADATRIDVTGCVVTPGLIDARSTLWLTAAAAREGAADGSLDVLDGIDPHEEDWKEVARQGVTAVY